MPRILVVEDEPLIAFMLKDWLSELGCDTLGPADCVKTALDIIRQTEIEGAILDVSLGGEDCFSVADVLREKGVPFAFVTGHDAKAVAPRFEGELVLQKPFVFSSVQSTVSKLLDAR